MKNYLSVDIGGSAIKYAHIQEDGNILENGSFQINNDDVSDLVTNIKELVKKYGDITGIAISSPGVVDKVNKEVTGCVAVEAVKAPSWVKGLEVDLGINCSIENDANCATLAELWIGNGKNYKNLVSVVIGTGIGSTIVVDGKIIYGAHGYAAELGYIVHRVGNKFESESNTTSTRSLVDRVNRVYPVANGLEVFENMHRKEVKQEYDSYVLDLGIFMYNIIHTLDPEIILLGGAISNNEHILEDIKNAYEEVRIKMDMSEIKLNIEKCKFKNDANLIGALYNYLNN